MKYSLIMYTDHSMSGLSNLAMCIRLSKTIIMSMLIILIPKENIRTEVEIVWHFQYVIIVTVYSEPAIGNYLLCKKHIRYFLKKLNKYTGSSNFDIFIIFFNHQVNMSSLLHTTLLPDDLICTSAFFTFFECEI